MDATSIFFVAVIVLLGGPLALFADWLGRRLGKRRHSLFGLRPRHTASLLTFLAGVFIPLLTVLAMLALSKDVRALLFDRQRILNQRDRLQHEVGDETKALQDTQNKRTAAERGLAGAKQQYSREEQLAKNLSARIKTLSAQLGAEKRVLAAQGAEVRRLSAEVRAKAFSIADINRRRERAEADYAKASGDLKALQVSYKALRIEYDSLDQERTKLNKENQDLSKQIGTLTPEVASLNAQKLDLENTKVKLNAQLESANNLLNARNDELRHASANLAETIREANEQISAYQTQPMIYHKDDELVRVSVDARLSEDDARRQVALLLTLARTQASGRGAEATEDVNVVGFAPVVGSDNMTPLEVQSALTRGITRLREPAVMISTTPVNVFKTQPVIIQVRVLPNPLVYRQGQSIADTRIDGSKSFDQIVESLRSFLADKVTLKAVSDQMIPRQGQDSPLGEVTIKQITDVVRAIQTEARTVKVSAIAKTDTHAADPLQIEFRVGR